MNCPKCKTEMIHRWHSTYICSRCDISWSIDMESDDNKQYRIRSKSYHLAEGDKVFIKDSSKIHTVYEHDDEFEYNGVLATDEEDEEGEVQVFCVFYTPLNNLQRIK